MQLVGAAQELAEYGPMKPLDQQGLDEVRHGGEAVGCAGEPRLLLA